MVLQAQCQKKQAICQTQGKAPVCFPQQCFSDLKRFVDVPIEILSAGTQEVPVGSPLAKVKYLDGDDFDQNILVHIVLLVTLSVCVIARCSLLHSNPTILRYDNDNLIAFCSTSSGLAVLLIVDGFGCVADVTEQDSRYQS